MTVIKTRKMTYEKIRKTHKILVAYLKLRATWKSWK